MGDPIKYTLTIESDDKTKVTPPDLGANLGSFEIRDYSVHRSRTKTGRRWTVTFVLAAYDTGKFTVPPVSVVYEVEGKVGELSSQPVEIAVESVKPSEQADLKDLKPPGSVQLTAWDFRWLILSVVALMGVAVGLLLLFRRRSSEELEQTISVDPPVPPDHEAVTALERLANSGLLESGQVKEFYTRLSEILRRYLERQFEIPALESTTGEIVDRLHLANFEGEERQLAVSLLNLCDLVKFAKLLPPVERGTAGIEEVRRLVLNSAARIAAKRAAAEAIEAGVTDATG